MKKVQKAIIVFDLIILIVITAGVAGNFINTDRVTQVFYMLSPDKNVPTETQDSNPGQNAEKTQSALDKDIKKVALTFDDGPNQEYTEELLKSLKEKNVKATFFLLGAEVEKYPELVKKIYDEGHLIGNHLYKHERLERMSSTEACSQVNKTNDLISNIIGEIPQYYRPPFGEHKDNLDCEVNMIQVMWNIDTQDWMNQNQDKIVQKVMTKVKENDIILMHDGYKSTIKATMQIIDMLRKEGYEFVTVDELIME